MAFIFHTQGYCFILVSDWYGGAFCKSLPFVLLSEMLSDITSLFGQIYTKAILLLCQLA